MSERTIASIGLLGGHVALDFTNTVDSRGDRWGPDFLCAYSDLVVWAQRVQLVDGSEAALLLQTAKADPGEAGEALNRAKRLREALHAVFAAEARGRRADPEVESEVTDAVAKASAFRILVPEPKGFLWRWSNEGLDAVAYRLAFAAAQLLVQRPDRRDVRECLGPNCGWLFIDTSRGGKRRWCSDKSCGTHTRVRRFRAKES